MSLKAISLQDIYGAAGEKHRARYESLGRQFEKRFGRKAEAFYRAPGRVELGGNHTDHQGGVTLSASVDLDLIAAVSPADDGRICLYSEGFSPLVIELADSAFRKEEKETTTALIRGMTEGLRPLAAHFPENGKGGFSIFIRGNVPPGSGLSSSAAFEILIGTVLWDLYGEGELSSVTLAKIAQQAENRYFGKPCGLLDQISCAAGGVVSVDFSGKEPWVRRVASSLEEGDYQLGMVFSGASHQDLTEEYAAIPRECRMIAAYFGKDRLCELPEKDFTDNLRELRLLFGDRPVLRALHVYEENRRALSEAMCLLKGDTEGFLRLVNASGKSSAMYLQNVSIRSSVSHQELLFALGLCEYILRGRGAVRVHGGGFGGTAEVFVPKDQWESFRAQVEAVLGDGSVIPLALSPVGGAKVDFV